MSFSSYAGYLESLDDFYIMDRYEYVTVLLLRRWRTFMHGSIWPVTIPRGQPLGQVLPFGPGGGDLFQAVLSQG